MVGMRRGLDFAKAQTALKRAAYKAVHGTREEQSGRFVQVTNQGNSMPRDVLEFRVVVGSPSDLFDFRKAVFEVIDELNRAFEIQKISIRGLGWEEYVTPGIGSDPQNVINEQLLKEYDILIALFAYKLGSPTTNAASGTIEEIEHAIANKESPMGRHRVQVYFRNKIENTSEISIEELKKVFEYREKLKPLGVLYGSFKDREDLQKEVRINLQRPILDYLKNRPSSSPRQSATEIAESRNDIEGAAPLEEADDLGVLDYQERSEIAIETTNRSMSRMAVLIEEIGAETKREVERVESASFLNASATEKKATINNFASFIKNKATELRIEANIADENFASFADSIVLLANADPHRGTEQYQMVLEKFLAAAEEMLKTATESRLSMWTFRTTVESIPRITIQFNQAKKMLLEAIDKCLAFLDNAERKIYEMTART
jgi:hypothetical protein